jgi:lysozyme family protein
MSAANYPSPILDFTLKYEGGWSDNPRDPGGATMKGVTLATYAAFKGRPVSKGELNAIPDADLFAIYRKGYWDAVDGDRLPAGPDLCLFDIGVNSGPARALSWWRACPQREPVAAVTWLCARRRSFWQGLKIFATFGRGWLARGAACEALALTIAAGAAAPDVLAEQARDATRKTQGATAGAAATTAGAPVAATQTASGWVLAAMLVVIAGAMAFQIYHALAQRARAKALSATLGLGEQS